MNGELTAENLLLKTKMHSVSMELTFRKATGSEWVADRDAYHFHRDEIVKALGETLKMSKDSASSALFSIPERSDFKYVVMPMRI